MTLTTIAFFAVGALSGPEPSAPLRGFRPVTIQQILNRPVYDQRVRFRASLESEIETNEFRLRDATGQIRAEAGPEWYQSIELPVGEEFTVWGEVDFYRNRPEIDLWRIELKDGRTIEIQGEGPPPWAGQEDR